MSTPSASRSAWLAVSSAQRQPLRGFSALEELDRSRRWMSLNPAWARAIAVAYPVMPAPTMTVSAHKSRLNSQTGSVCRLNQKAGVFNGVLEHAVCHIARQLVDAPTTK